MSSLFQPTVPASEQDLEMIAGASLLFIASSASSRVQLYTYKNRLGCRTSCNLSWDCCAEVALAEYPRKRLIYGASVEVLSLFGV